MLPKVTGWLDLGTVLMQRVSEIPPFIPWWIKRLPRRLRSSYVRKKLDRVMPGREHP